MQKALLIFFVATLVSCTQQQNEPLKPCFGLIDKSGFTSAHYKAFQNSLKLHAKSCSAPGVECGYKVTRNKENQLLVNTGYFYRMPETFECVQPIGGYQIDVYDASGNFLRSVPGL